MNLKEILKSKLENNYQNLDTIGKIVYIYKKLCEVFQYDCRWYWAIDDQPLQIEIYERKLDIENLEDIKVVCTSFSDIYCNIVNSLLTKEEDYDISLPYGELSHCYSITQLMDGTTIEVDPIDGTDDFLNVKKGLPFRGLKIYTREDDGEYLLEKAMYDINYTKQNLYLKYLHLVRDELIEEKSNITTNRLFHFFIDTTNFSTLGIKETNDLFLLTVKQTMNQDAKSLKFKRLVLYDNENKKVNLLYQVPKDENEVEYYSLTTKEDKISWQKVEEPISEYIENSNYHFVEEDKVKFLTKKTSPISKM